jgi:hypothetical protein
MSGIITKLLVLLIFFCPLSNISTAASIDTMQLLGKGEAYYLKFIKVYDASLYIEESVEAKHILDRNISKCLYIQYAVGVDADDFIAAANTVLARQFSSERLNDVASELATLHGGYMDVQEGDSYSLCYSKVAETTTLALNEKEVVSVYSPDFAEIYFSIWLGESDPLDEKLRNNLLANESN